MDRLSCSSFSFLFVPPYGDFRKRLVASFFHGAFLVLQRVKMFARMVCGEKCPKEPSVRRRGVVVVVGVSKIINKCPNRQ